MNLRSELLVALTDGGDEDPLYCVHPVSGSVYGYLGLARSLGGSPPVVGIEASGFDTDLAPAATVGEQSAEYVRALPPAAAYHLLGWSMGGLVAFDMAHRIMEAGRAVGSLILIDTPVPTWAEPPPEAALLERFLCDMFGTPTLADAGLAEVFAGLPDPVEPIRLFTRLAGSDMGLDTDGIDPDFLLRRYAVFRANVVAAVDYRISDPYPGVLAHISGSVTASDPSAWEPFAAKLEYHVVPGNHFTIWAGAGLAEISRIVRDYVGASNVT
ncbi:MAG TPA: alpha/beta fold hydrolase [Pseudonocardiaceae bacterium]